MEAPCELGVLADFHRTAIQEPYTNILWELLANRKWNSDKSTAKYLFLRYNGYFILGSNHFRSCASIEKEHTPFKFNASNKEADASISARGYGAKLHPFYVQGNYCVLYRNEDSHTFSDDLNEWGMRDWVNLTNLGRIIDSGKKERFNANQYRGIYYNTITDKPAKQPEIPFFLEQDFVDSPVNAFIKKHNFKYFYVFVDPDTRVERNLDKALGELAAIYEGSDLEIYTSKEIDDMGKKIIPEPSLVSSEIGYGLNPKDWVGSMTLEWRIGERTSVSSKNNIKNFYKSEFCLKITGSDRVIWGMNDTNGSADKFGMRFRSFNKPDDWKPHVCVTVSLIKQSILEKIKKDGCTDENLAKKIYLRIEGDLISLQTPDSNMESKLRQGKGGIRERVIVDILEESVKTNPESGLLINSVKAKSKIEKDKAIYEMIWQTLTLFNKHISRISDLKPDSVIFCNNTLVESLKGDIEKDKAAAKRHTKRKQDGHKFEHNIAEYLKRGGSAIEFDENTYDINWLANDSAISATHDLGELQGIDILGELRLDTRSIWIAIQAKDHEQAVPKSELKKFTDTVKLLESNKLALNKNDKFVSILSLAKTKSFSYNLHEDMIKDGIITVVESSIEEVGSKTYSVIEFFLNKIL